MILVFWMHVMPVMQVVDDQLVDVARDHPQLPALSVFALLFYIIK